MKAEGFIKELEDAGYRMFKDNFKSSTAAYQKRFKDKLGTKYFITIYYYAERYYNKEQKAPASFDVDLQLIKIFKGKEFVVDLGVFGLFDWIDGASEFYSLELIEDFIEEMFTHNKFEYYELNN